MHTVRGLLLYLILWPKQFHRRVLPKHHWGIPLKIKWQSFNYFSAIVIYNRAANVNHFAENRIKKFQLVAELCQLKVK